MRDQKVRVVQWGCGLMGQIIIRYLQEKGAELVGAIDRNASRVGRDAGEVAGLAPLNVTVRPPQEAAQVFQEAKADVCILCTRSTMEEMFDALATAARHGVNAITMGEEAFFPWKTSPELTQRLHDLALEGSCTLTGSGYQDVFWGYLVAVIAGATHRIDRIQGLTQYNADDYGSAVAEKHGVGLTKAQFAERIAAKNTPSYAWNGNEWLCARLGLNARSMRQEIQPTTHPEPLPSRSIKTEIAPGHATGMRAVVTTETEEGPVIEMHCVGKVYAPGEVDVNEWSLVGTPSTTVTIRSPATPELTCATMVNRLPQLIAAPPGFITSDKLAQPDYQPRPLHRKR